MKLNNFLLAALLENDNNLLVFYVNYMGDKITPKLPELTVVSRVTSVCIETFTKYFQMRSKNGNKINIEIDILTHGYGGTIGAELGTSIKGLVRVNNLFGKITF